MNLQEVIERECPRYAKKETIYCGERKQVIIDLHSPSWQVHGGTVIGVYPLDENIEEILDSMNKDYEIQLLKHFKRIQ